METWHQKNFLKYDGLCRGKKSNGWSAHFFAVEVGARGYCATTTKSCLLRLGLGRKLVKATIKSLSLASLTASFQIWHARDTIEWTPNKIPLVQNTNKHFFPCKFQKVA